MLDNTPRMPTPSAIIKAWNKFEEAFVVFEQVWNAQPNDETPIIYYDDMDALWNAHSAFRGLARYADAKKAAAAAKKAAK